VYILSIQKRVRYALNALLAQEKITGALTKKESKNLLLLDSEIAIFLRE
jgi:hypothetical protein